MANDAATVFAQTPPSEFGLSSAPAGTGVDGFLQRISDVSRINNEVSAQQAAIQRSWQEQQNRRAMDFNAAEAAENRNWQEYMSNTAHQREVRDLVAAGLNPILSASGGNGASVGSGATASGVTSSGAKGDVDTSSNQAFASLVSAMLQTQASTQNAMLSAMTNESIADRNNAASALIAELYTAATKYSADQSASASRYMSDNSAAATRYAADASAKSAAYSSQNALQASMYGSTVSANATKYAADEATHRAEMELDNPDDLWSLLNSIVNGVDPSDSHTGLKGVFGKVADAGKRTGEAIYDWFASRGNKGSASGNYTHSGGKF